MMCLNFLFSSPCESLARTLDIKASNNMTIMSFGAAAGVIKVGMTSMPSRAAKVPGSGLRNTLIIPSERSEIRKKPKDLSMFIKQTNLIRYVL
mgnify:CR=1 FL=1